MIQRLRDWCLRRWVEVQLPRKRDDRALIDLSAWRNLAPGRVNISTAPDGQKWAVMHLDDFDHLCQLAKVNRVALTETVK